VIELKYNHSNMRSGKVTETASVVLPHDDISMEDFYEAVKRFALVCGYHPDTVTEYFGEGG